MPGARSGTLVTVDRPLVAAAEKAAWAARIGDGSAAVDMESAAWARAAAARGIPYIVVRAVSDAADEELPGYLSRCMDADGGIRRSAWRCARSRSRPRSRRCSPCAGACAIATERLAAFVEHFLAGVA